jgi:hypothetical protein
MKFGLQAVEDGVKEEYLPSKLTWDDAGRKNSGAWLGKGHAYVCFHATSTASRLLLSISAIMRVVHSFVSSLLLSSATIVSAASSWGFEDATVSVASKGAGVGGGSKDK